MNIVPVTCDQIHAMWPVLSSLVERVAEEAHGTYTAEDIRSYCMSRDMQMWVAMADEIRAVIVTEIVVYPRKKVLNILAISGRDFDEWGSALDTTLREFAQGMGCTVIEAYGRRGWERKISSLGYKPISVHYAKEI